MRWSGIPLFKNFPQFVVTHTVKGFSIVKEAELDVFLELSCFFYDPSASKPRPGGRGWREGILAQNADAWAPFWTN